LGTAEKAERGKSTPKAEPHYSRTRSGKGLGEKGKKKRLVTEVLGVTFLSAEKGKGGEKRIGVS